MNKITIAIIAATLTCSAAAQDFTNHEVSVNIGGGVSSFQTRPTVGKNLGNWASNAGLGYSYFFNQSWAIGTGINFAFYKGGISIDNHDWQQAAINKETGHAFDFLVNSSRYKETQRVTMVTIPLMAQYQYQYEEKIPLYAAFGFKLGIPVSAKNQSKGNFTTKGYYPNLNVTYEDLSDYGFVTNQPFPKNKTDIGLKTAFMMSAELGVKYPLSEKFSLYAGIYVDYGLNNMLKGKSAGNLVGYQTGTPSQFVYNAAANSYARKMAPFAGGVTVRLSFGTDWKSSIQ